MFSTPTALSGRFPIYSRASRAVTPPLPPVLDANIPPFHAFEPPLPTLCRASLHLALTMSLRCLGTGVCAGPSLWPACYFLRAGLWPQQSERSGVGHSEPLSGDVAFAALCNGHAFRGGGTEDVERSKWQVAVESLVLTF